ncbi:MAG: Uncharacterised protein [Bacteroidota bacterium]|nr:MAG: Uncharacterised protein [Bacteroidota bacterium]
MEWYIPFTIIPGVGLIILSTSNILLSLNSEITNLKTTKEKKYKRIIELKLNQLKKLSWAAALQYAGLFNFLFSGIIAALAPQFSLISKYVLVLGGLSIGASIFLLIVYSFKAINIRQQNLSL